MKLFIFAFATMSILSSSAFASTAKLDCYTRLRLREDGLFVAGRESALHVNLSEKNAIALAHFYPNIEVKIDITEEGLGNNALVTVLKQNTVEYSNAYIWGDTLDVMIAGDAISPNYFVSLVCTLQK